jgi:hypothetical protein
LLRCLDIEDDSPKFKFYVELVEDRFGGTGSRPILQQVLRYTLKQSFMTLQPV